MKRKLATRTMQLWSLRTIRWPRRQNQKLKLGRRGYHPNVGLLWLSGIMEPNLADHKKTQVLGVLRNRSKKHYLTWNASLTSTSVTSKRLHGIELQERTNQFMLCKTSSLAKFTYQKRKESQTTVSKISEKDSISLWIRTRKLNQKSKFFAWSKWAIGSTLKLIRVIESIATFCRHLCWLQSVIFI